ncbi:UDP-4-amino-4,6-dideoxy-N-acetyl-beta-L-altrosamine transaminase [Methanobacterium sp. BAmetb5]|uniref:UDP-4-amino-4, 6-dideoxy-N-acetyl-beta-L-altrosamine transaminase n=1 Tax=Methanobacterium sp. BAmetb5 TaxID=2025351 RepID=UPI000E8D8654|nr:UDP-4-amino-4,6-dideoxy-N-acetyl-beta-L-altrosamine transaminase [Methanobacterium sp. BAmetb5]AXV38917.1 MAG: UDP-4-amino-4,6-dideoxy-N-acetyl-beta-L-altrosamine transaminase [Methanobacterium sp. BAmetb5]
MSKLAILGGKPVFKEFIPFSRHSIGKEEITEVLCTLNSDWITRGPKTFKFEEMFSSYVDSKFSLAVNSCTAALHLVLAGLDIGKGDEVITTPLTFAATSEVIIHQNAKPVFADVERDTYNIDPSKLEEKISKNTKAIIPVHYAGHPCDMDEIMRIASDYDLYVIEDAAHAIGSKYKGRNIGTIGDATCFSFYATKNLATGEGGMITTNNEELAEKMRILSLHGISKDAWKRYSSEGSWYYEILYPGYKYNMSDIEASIGIHQLKKLDSMQKRRNEIATIYNKSFKEVLEIITPAVKDYAKHAWHLYPILVNNDLLNINRNDFIEALKAENIGTSVHFIPLHFHPYYNENYGFKKGDFPVAESIYEKEISLPIYPKMTDEDVHQVVNAVKKIINYYRV